MACNTLINSKNRLVELGVIGKTWQLLDMDKFNRLNQLYTDTAAGKYGLETGGQMLFSSSLVERKLGDGSIKRLVRVYPNNKLFEELDIAVENYVEPLESKDFNSLVGDRNIFDINPRLRPNSKTSITGTKLENFKALSSAMFNGEPKNMSAQDVLANLAQSNLIKSEYLNDMLHNLAVQSKAKVKIVENKDLPNKDTYMYYDPNNNTIHVSKDKLGAVSPELGAAKFIHEVFHERTYRVLSTPKNESEQSLVDDINLVYEFVKEEFRARPEFKHELSSIHEFTAGMFSNPQFENAVKESIARDTFWDRLKAFFLNMFGIYNNEFNELLDNILKLSKVEDNEVSVNKILAPLESKVTPEYRSVQEDFGVKSLEKTSQKISDLLETFFNISKRTQSGYNEKVGDIISTLSELKEKYKDAEDTYHALAVAKYVKFMSNQMDNFEKRLDNPNSKFDAKLYTQMENYLGAFSLINEVAELNTSLHRDGIIDDKKYDKYNKAIRKSMAKFNSNKNKLNVMAKEYLVNNFASPEYFKEEYLRYKDFYMDQAKEVYPNKGSKAQRERYVNKKLAENREMIAARTKDRFKQLIEGNKQDISNLAAMINSEKALNNSIVQILSRVLDKNELEYKNEIFPTFREMDEAYEQFMQGKKRNTSSDKLFKNLVEHSEYGGSYLKSEYSVKFMDKHKQLMADISNALETHGPLSDQYRNAIKAKKTWFKKNTVKLGQGQFIPTDNWKTDLTSLTIAERDYLEHIREVATQANDNLGGVKELKKNYLGATYYRLPGVRKSAQTKLTSGEFTGGLREKVKEMFTRQADQTDEGEISQDSATQKVFTDLSGKEINYIPIHFRNTLEQNEQSIDLSTIYAMELENSIKFKHKNRIHADMNLFIDVLKQSDFTKKVGIQGKTLTSLFSKDGATPVRISGENSNIVKLAETMMKNRMYDKIAEYGGQIGPADVNKLTGQMLGFTSQLGMALNYFGATANFAIGSVNNMLETIAGDTINSTNIKNALSMYSHNIPSMMKDVGKTTNASLINQIVDKFNIMGDVSNLKQAFEKNTKLTALFKGDSLQFMHNVGEHGMQTVLTLAVLDSVKLTNKAGEYLDKNGKVTDDINQAVSLMEAYTLDDKGNLTTKMPVEYTSIDNLNKFKDGGENNVRGIVKQMILRNHGNYDSRIQSEFQRHWYGKMIMMYKKHIESPILNRWRGGATALKKRSELTRDQLKYNYDLNKIDEGYYVSMIRFMRHTVLPNLKALKLNMIGQEYNKLDEWEKANLRRTMAEVATIGMMAAVAQILAAVADDDNEALWFAAYIFRRMQSDLSQYHNPNEAWRILKNPFASLRQIEAVTSIVETAFTPWSWGDEYKGGPYKGDNILGRKLLKLTPVLTRKDLSAKQAFSYINR